MQRLRADQANINDEGGCGGAGDKEILIGPNYGSQTRMFYLRRGIGPAEIAPHWQTERIIYWQLRRASGKVFGQRHVS